MSLRELRRRIDAIDDKIVELLNRRTAIALEIGKLKGRRRKKSYAPDRESQIMRRLRARSQGPFPSRGLGAVYREIMSATRDLQGSLTVAYWGPAGSFTHQAAHRKFGSSAAYTPSPSIADVFADVERGQADYGVVPIENSTEGAVNYTLDRFVDSDVKICAEVSLQVEHCLLSRGGRQGVGRVYSNPQAMAQCRHWLEDHLRRAELVEVSTTSEAARRASRERSSAAIASALAARVYGLKVLARRIEDSPSNVTRFLIVGREDSPPTGRDKTSIMFSIRDRVGALHDMLRFFKEQRINLSMIESRPSRRKAWDYFFFVDLEGHVQDPRLRKALASLEKECAFMKVLGSYPMSDSA